MTYKDFSKKITKAVFPVAGLGARFLPATKAMPKELLPILNKPLIQYAVEEAIDAGIDTLVFVTGRNKRAIEDHFDAHLELENELINRGKIGEAKMVANTIPKNVKCVFVRQPKQLGLGHAILCSEAVVGNEPFAVLLADDFIVNGSEGNTKELVKAYASSEKSQILYETVKQEEVNKYGILKWDVTKKIVSGLVEKPDTDKAPSSEASIGRYVLNPNIFDVLRDLKPGAGNEIQLADAINIQAKKNDVFGIKLTGKRFDCGTVSGFVDATLHVAGKRGYLK